MGFQDVAFLPEDLWTTTCLRTVVGGRQGHAPCKASGPPHVLELWLGVGKGMLPVKKLSLKQILFFFLWHFMEITKLSQS